MTTKPFESLGAPVQHSSAPGNSRGGQTILFAWELGGGFGHVRTLLRVARALAAEGHRPIFVVKDVIGPWAVLRELRWPVLLAPTWSLRPSANEPPFLATGFADILSIHGFASIDTLFPLVSTWQGLLELLRPALIVVDYSPVLHLAAFGGDIPIVDVGNGFAQPPVHLPTFPPLTTGRPPRATEAELLQVVLDVQRQRGRPAPATLPALFAAASRYVAVLPELDPYQETRPEPAAGAMEPLPPRLSPPATPRYFAYLSAEWQALETVLRLLAQSGYPGSIYLRNAGSSLWAFARQLGLDVFESPPPLETLLSTAGVLVHHSSMNVAQIALAAGRPQLLFPQHLEHSLMAVRLHRLGVAHYLTNDFPAADVPEGLRQLFSAPFIDRAQTLAGEIHARVAIDVLPAVLQRCRELLG